MVDEKHRWVAYVFIFQCPRIDASAMGKRSQLAREPVPYLTALCRNSSKNDDKCVPYMAARIMYRNVAKSFANVFACAFLVANGYYVFNGNGEIILIFSPIELSLSLSSFSLEYDFYHLAFWQTAKEWDVCGGTIHFKYFFCFHSLCTWYCTNWNWNRNKLLV